MSIIPEYVFRRMLVKGLRAFRENPKLIDALFPNMLQSEVLDIRQYFINNAVEICINYPDQNVKTPAIVITLKNEIESQAFLGDLQIPTSSLREAGVVPFPKDTLQGDQTIVGSGSTGDVGYSGGLLHEPTLAIGGASNEIWGPSSLTRLIDPYEQDAYVVLMEGTGEGQRKKITSIIPSITHGRVTIEVEDAWDTIPDTTTVFQILTARDPDAVEGEPSRVFYPSDNIEGLGQLYAPRYVFDINAGSQDEVVILYTLVKAIVVSSKRYLQKQGILYTRMSGADFLPIPDYFPNGGFRRALTIECEYAFEVYRDISEAVATTLELYISWENPTTEIEETLIETEFDVP